MCYLLPMAPGTNYVRWGRTTCPYTATLVYHGLAAGSWWSATGGGANYLCLPHQPQYLSYSPGHQSYKNLHGTEYEFWDGTPYNSRMHHHNVPCAVCTVSRSQKLMIPARYSCPSGWTREYYGYLMTTSAASPHHRTMYECMDWYPTSAPGSAKNKDGAVFYHVEASCNGVPCPPYDKEKELTCVVCTK